MFTAFRIVAYMVENFMAVRLLLIVLGVCVLCAELPHWYWMVRPPMYTRVYPDWDGINEDGSTAAFHADARSR